MKTFLGKHTGRKKKEIDIEYILKEIKNGRTITSLAEEYHVSRTTIYSHYKKYQENKNAPEQKTEDSAIYPELGDNPFE